MLTDAITPPLWTTDLPGIGGRIKEHCRDFEVEEIPAYEPSGTGEHLFVWIEKEDVSAEYLQRLLARALDLKSEEIGMAGLKDRRALTRQWVSLPARVEASLATVSDPRWRILRSVRHGNKLRTGHLHGNRFRILIRGVHEAEHGGTLNAILDRLRETGLPNYYGIQRFGHQGETARWGLALLKGEKPTFAADTRPPNLRSPFMKKLVLSAGQSLLFNAYLGRRIQDGYFRQVLLGDVMAKWPFGGMFVAEDLAAEQQRFDAREIVSAGPIFGRKTFAAAATAAEREAAVLAEAGLSTASFEGFGKFVEGTRRHNVIYLEELGVEWVAEGVWLSFVLPAGSYATVVLREVMKNEPTDEDGSPSRETPESEANPGS